MGRNNDYWRLVLRRKVREQTQRALVATSSQKRALDEQNLKGGSSQSPPKSTTPTSPTPSSGGGGGMGFALLGLAGGATAATAAYLYSTGRWDPSFLTSVLKKEATTDVASIDVDEKKEITKDPIIKESEDMAPIAKEMTQEETINKEQLKTETVDTTTDDTSRSIETPLKTMETSEASALKEEPSSASEGTEVPMDVTKPVKKEKVKKQKKKKVKDEPSKDLADTSFTNEAIRQLQSSATIEAAKSLVKSHQSLWASLDATYLNDLDDLTNTQLKARVAQLATELKDRTQWEAVRLKEFLALKEKEVAQQYTELLQKQRLEFENLLATRLREQDDAFRGKMMETLREKDATIQAVVDAALAAQQEEHDLDKEAFTAKLTEEVRTEIDQKYGDQMEAYKRQTEQNLQEKVQTLTMMSEKLKQLEFALEASQKNQEGSSMAHRLSAAALALSEILETHAPAGKEVQALKTAAGRDGVIATAVRTLPKTVDTDGVLTLPELQVKFEENYSTCRAAALVPEGRPGLDGQLAGMLFARLKYPPLPEDPAPEGTPNNPEHVLARARKHVKLGELSAAVDELEKLQGQVAFVIEDWKKAAMDRIAVDKAIKVIKLECALLHESVAE